MEIGEVLVLADYFTFVDLWEERVSQDAHDEEDEHEEEEHIEK